MGCASLFVLLAIAGQVVGSEAGPIFRPAGSSMIRVDPGVRTSIRLQRQSGNVPAPPSYLVRDYTGEVVSQGTTQRIEEDAWELPLRLEPGYFEVMLTHGGQRFGVVSLPAWTGRPDPFFAIDGALSVLVKDQSVRESLLEAVRQSGITMVRERLIWSEVNPGLGVWNLEGEARYDTLRASYRKSGIPVLELSHDTPRWLGRAGVYPQNLAGAAASWAKLGRRWSASWGGLETWNEPDIFFGGDRPADQYVAVSKAIAYGLTRAGVQTPVVGGVMANRNEEFLETAAACGMLDHIDVFSFHTYGKAEEMQPLVEGYRRWLARHGHGAMPLWITECGRPWKRGPSGPPMAEDQLSARDIVMKGVEARACGIARYFPFVLPFYEENNSNFGMTDRDGSPLRSFAAYAQMVRVLGHHPFLGDLRPMPEGLTRARVFDGGDHAILVLYSGDRTLPVLLPQGGKVRRIEGIDGRPLQVAPGGGVPLPDGLSYVWMEGPINPKDLDATSVASARPAPDAASTARAVSSPLVVRLRQDASRLKHSARGYQVTGDAAAPLPLEFEIWNLGDTPRSPHVTLSMGQKARLPERTIELAPRSMGTVSWTIDAGAAFTKADRLTLRLAARDSAGAEDALVTVLRGEPDLARVLAQTPRPIALPISERPHWTPSHNPEATLVIDATAEAPWRLRVNDERGKDRWAYPIFALPEDVHLDRTKSLVFRGRCTPGAKVRMLLFEGELSRNVVYLTANPVIPDDGRWHVARVSYRDLVPSTANAPDPDGQLDLAAVRHLSLGMNLTANQGSLELSGLHVVGAATPKE